jgi:hypothetical protein
MSHSKVFTPDPMVVLVNVTLSGGTQAEVTLAVNPGWMPSATVIV